MLSANIPARFGIPWGASAGGAYIRTIPQASQIGITGGAASLTDGFPPLNFTQIGAGGVPPFGQDFNGILNQITKWNQWHAAGGPVGFDSTFSTTVGGYPAGAVLISSFLGNWWFNGVDNNTGNPNAGASNWLGIGFVPTGGMIAFAGPTAPAGWALCAGQVVVQTGIYAGLFAVIGTTYNTGGEGAGNFRLPDLKGRSPFGQDNMGGSAANRITAAVSGLDGTALGGAGGGSQGFATGIAKTYLQSFTLAGSKAYSDASALWVKQAGAGTFTGNTAMQTGAAPFVATINNTAGFAQGAPGFTVSGSDLSSGGGGTAFPTLPPALITLWIIKL